MLPLYNWGANARVVATVDDHGPIVLAVLETMPPQDDWSGEVWLLTAGTNCVPAPVIAPVGPAPIGERFVIRLSECLCSYDLLSVDGTATGWQSTEPCIGQAACVLLLRPEADGDWEQVWAVQRVDRENDENVWQVFDVFTPEPGAEVIAGGLCEWVSSDEYKPFYAIHQTEDGLAAWVLTLDKSTATFAEQSKDDDVSCYHAGEGRGPLVEFATV